MRKTIKKVIKNKKKVIKSKIKQVDGGSKILTNVGREITKGTKAVAKSGMSGLMKFLLAAIMVLILVILGNYARASFKGGFFKSGKTEVPSSVNLNLNKEEDVEAPKPPLKNVNIHTRGRPGEYTSIGTLSSEGTVLPLYGRKTYASSERFNYYTTNDSHNKVQIPLEFNGEECMKERGCREIMDENTLTIPELGEGTYTTKIYNNSELQYIPIV
jgi:hypothetical protein